MYLITRCIETPCKIKKDYTELYQKTMAIVTEMVENIEKKSPMVKVKLYKFQPEAYNEYSFRIDVHINVLTEYGKRVDDPGNRGYLFWFFITDSAHKCQPTIKVEKFTIGYGSNQLSLEQYTSEKDFLDDVRAILQSFVVDDKMTTNIVRHDIAVSIVLPNGKTHYQNFKIDEF